MIALLVNESAARSRRVRPRSGWSSVRVDRETLARLQRLRWLLPQLLHADAEPLSMVELLEVLSLATLADTVPRLSRAAPGLSLARQVRRQLGGGA
jgi:hypothetical protein